MTERQLQFRVGLFVLVAAAATGLMVFKFGEIRNLWEPTYSLTIHFERAPGVYPQTPVQRNGITIGSVRDVTFDDARGGVAVLVEIRQAVRMRTDATPRLVRSLLGDAKIDFVPGKSDRFHVPGAVIEGVPPSDPLAMVERLEDRVTHSLDTFAQTSREWQQVGRNLNDLMQTNRGNFDTVIERSAESLHQFNLTMQSFHTALEGMHRIVGDPRNQQNLQHALAELPAMVSETRDAIRAVRSAVVKADENLTNLSHVTAPLAERSRSVVDKLDATLTNLESLSGELDQFVKIIAREDGSLQQFVSNPQLYDNLNRSAASMAVLVQALEPTLRDLRILSDKLARHPELLGVGGALRPSSGLKTPADAAAVRQSYRPGQPRQ